MGLVRGILDRLVLVAAILAAGCVPSFIAQYRQRLGGRLEQVVADLLPFQQIAERFHGGSLRALVEHHLRSSDATFHAEGAAIEAMMSSEARLRDMSEGLNADLFHQVGYLLAHYDAGLGRATWGAFQPGFTLTADALVLALSCGVLLWLAFLGAWSGIAYLVRVAMTPTSPTRPRRTPTLR